MSVRSMQNWLAIASNDYRISGAEMKLMLSQRDDFFSAPMSVGSVYEKDEYVLVQALNNAVSSGLSPAQVEQSYGVKVAPGVARYIPMSVLDPTRGGLVALDHDAVDELQKFARKDYDDKGARTAVKTVGSAAAGAGVGFMIGGPVGAGIGAGVGALAGWLWGSSDD